MSPSVRDDWAAERRRIEQGTHWIGPTGRYPKWRNKVFKAAAGVGGWGIWAAGLHGRGRRNALSPRLVEIEIALPGLPAAFDGYRILQLSDTHLDLMPSLAAIAGRMLEGIAVDLLVHTGDTLSLPNAPLAAATAPLTEAIRGVTVRERRLAVLGNHDPADMVEALEEIGFEVLVNRSLILARGGEQVQIVGLDDVHSFYTKAARDALFERLADFRVALVHSAEMAEDAAAAGIGLYLSGHTHGGQICLPGGRHLFSGLKRCRFAVRGLWRSGPTVGYSSCGLGASPPTLRFNCAGEMTVFTLCRAG